jgi:hypothetical protein
MIFEPMVRLAQTVHLSCVKINTISKWTKLRFHLSLLTSEYHWVRPKQFYEPMVPLVQTIHLSCTDTNTVSERTETRFHMTHITYEFHRLRPKRFLSLWYVWHKPYIYLAPTLILSTNGPKRGQHDPRHLGVPSGASKKIL